MVQVHAFSFRRLHSKWLDSRYTRSRSGVYTAKLKNVTCVSCRAVGARTPIITSITVSAFLFYCVNSVLVACSIVFSFRRFRSFRFCFVLASSTCNTNEVLTFLAPTVHVYKRGYEAKCLCVPHTVPSCTLVP